MLVIFPEQGIYIHIREVSQKKSMDLMSKFGIKTSQTTPFEIVHTVCKILVMKT